MKVRKISFPKSKERTKEVLVQLRTAMLYFCIDSRKSVQNMRFGHLVHVSSFLKTGKVGYMPHIGALNVGEYKALGRPFSANFHIIGK